MPFVISLVNVEVTERQELELRRRLGRAIALVPGKSEAYLFIDFENCCHLCLGGHADMPLAYLDVSIFANEGHRGYGAFTEAVTAAYHEVLGIDPTHVYLRFSDISAWGVGGQYVDRGMFA